MNVIDRVESAKHTLTGSGISKAISKATSHEVIGPKKKHVDYIQAALEFDNVSIPNAADMLFERCTNSSWVVVFKSLAVFHQLMANANERFIQYVASRSTTWMLQNFLDKGVQAYDMSHAIRRYSKYLSEKAYSYRYIGYDFCRVPRGKESGLLRNMDTTKLLKALPAIQNQLDALVTSSFNSNDLVNGVVTAAFMLLFKDLIRLFACYNDGIINLLEKYFDMKKADCKTSLEIYKRFLARMERVCEFLKVAEDAGIEKGDIPDLTKAPNSLVDALESHYQYLEKGKTAPAPQKPTMSFATLDVSQNNASVGFGGDSTDSYLEQERRMLEMYEQKKRENDKLKQQTVPALDASNAFKHPHKSPSPVPAQQNLMNANTPVKTENNNSLKPSDDLMLLSMGPTSFDKPIPAFSNTSQQQFSSSMSAIDFNRAFNNNQPQQSTSTPNLLDDILLPEGHHQPNMANNPQQQQQQRMPDLNTGLERIAQSLDGLNVNPNTLKASTNRGHQWNPQQNTMKTGGVNYQMNNIALSTIPPVSPMYGGMQPTMMSPNYGYTPRMPQMQPMMQQPNMYAGGYPMMQQYNPNTQNNMFLQQRPPQPQQQFSNQNNSLF